MATVVMGRRGAIVAAPTTDKALLRSILERDRLYAAYALCDLEEREFSRTRWGVAWSGNTPIAVVLEYNGPTPQPMFVMGQEDGIRVDPPRPDPAARRVPRSAWPAALGGRVGLPGGSRTDDGPDVGRSRPVPAVSARRPSGSCPSTSGS